MAQAIMWFFVAVVFAVTVAIAVVLELRKRRPDKPTDERAVREEIDAFARSHTQPARSADLYEPYHRELLREIPEDRWRT